MITIHSQKLKQKNIKLVYNKIKYIILIFITILTGCTTTKIIDISEKPINNQSTITITDQLLEIIYKELIKSISEIPDGSNQSPDINNYWGQTGILGQPWCCAFVSWALNETLGFYPIGGKHYVEVQKMWEAAHRLGMETQDPKPGDIFIQIKSEGYGHTGFIVGVSPDGQLIYTAEGNSGNRLKICQRKRNTIDYFIDCIKDEQTIEFSRSQFDLHTADLEETR